MRRKTKALYYFNIDPSSERRKTIPGFLLRRRPYFEMWKAGRPKRWLQTVIIIETNIYKKSLQYWRECFFLKSIFFLTETKQNIKSNFVGDIISAEISPKCFVYYSRGPRIANSGGSESKRFVKWTALAGQVEQFYPTSPPPRLR